MCSKVDFWDSYKYTGLEVIEFFSSSTQMSMKFQLLVNVELVEISRKLGSVLNK